VRRRRSASGDGLLWHRPRPPIRPAALGGCGCGGETWEDVWGEAPRRYTRWKAIQKWDVYGIS
jgi:hypothetical protein